MLISFEGQPFYDNFKTGIGWYTYNIVNNLTYESGDGSFLIYSYDNL